jgi:hypothetical protein
VSCTRTGSWADAIAATSQIEIDQVEELGSTTLYDDSSETLKAIYEKHAAQRLAARLMVAITERHRLERLARRWGIDAPKKLDRGDANETAIAQVRRGIREARWTFFERCAKTLIPVLSSLRFWRISESSGSTLLKCQVGLSPSGFRVEQVSLAFAGCAGTSLADVSAITWLTIADEYRSAPIPVPISIPISVAVPIPVSIPVSLIPTTIAVIKIPEVTHRAPPFPVTCLLASVQPPEFDVRQAAFRQVRPVKTFLALAPAVVVLLPLRRAISALAGKRHAWAREGRRDEHRADVFPHGVSPSSNGFPGLEPISPAFDSHNAYVQLPCRFDDVSSAPVIPFLHTSTRRSWFQAPSAASAVSREEALKSRRVPVGCRGTTGRSDTHRKIEDRGPPRDYRAEVTADIIKMLEEGTAP